MRRLLSVTRIRRSARSCCGSVKEVGTKRLCSHRQQRFRARGCDGWLEQFGVQVVVPSDLDNLPLNTGQSYVIGPPTFFPASLVTAPATEAITFVMPSWFGNRSVPASQPRAAFRGWRRNRRERPFIGDVLQSPRRRLLKGGNRGHVLSATVWGSRSPKTANQRVTKSRPGRFCLAVGWRLAS